MANKANIMVAWPDRKLSPNYGDRGRYQKTRLRAEQRAAAKEDCSWWIDADWQAFTGSARMTVTFYPKDRRRRDLDNLFSMIKHAIDGVCETLGIDDSQLHPVVLDFGEPNPYKPYIEVEIVEAEGVDPFYGKVNREYVPTGKPAGRPRIKSEKVEERIEKVLLETPYASSNEIWRKVGGNRNKTLTAIRNLRVK